MSDDVLAEITQLYSDFNGLSASPNIFATRLLRICHEILLKDMPADLSSFVIVQGVALMERTMHEKTMVRYNGDVQNIKKDCRALINTVRRNCTNRPSNIESYVNALDDACKFRLSKYILAHELHCTMMDFILTGAFMATRLSMVETCALLVYFKIFIADLIDVMGHYVQLNANTENVRNRVLKSVQEIAHNYNVMYESRNERVHFDKLDVEQTAYCDARMLSNNAFDQSSEYVRFYHRQKSYLYCVFMLGKQSPYVKVICERTLALTLKILEILADIRTLDEISKARYDAAQTSSCPVHAKSTRVRAGNIANAPHVFKCVNLTFKVDTIALFQDCNIHINNKQWTMFYGNSGCGKTAFVQILMRQVVISPRVHLAGEIRYLGKYKDYTYDDIRDDVSYVAASGDLFKASISYNMLYGVPDGRKPLAEKYLSLFGLPHVEKRLAENIDVLSTGEKQRIRIIRMILQNKRIWFIDEATSNVDNHTENVILGCLRRIQRREKKTIIHITHNADNRKFADKMLSIQQKTMAYMR